jgi:TolB protein
MTSRRNSFSLYSSFPLLLAISLMWLPAAAAADKAISLPVQITHAQNFDPFPSPDGKKLVFISMLSGKEQLFIMDVDGSNVVQLTRDDADHEDPAWSPDGTRIAFVLITKDRHSIAVMKTDGSNVEVLTPPEQNAIHPNWSADSKRVIYCTNDDLAPPKKNSAEINTVDLTTKKITPLITGGINTYGSWSSDMKHIAFRKIIGDENSEVFVADGNGSNPRNLTNNPFFDGWLGNGSITSGFWITGWMRRCPITACYRRRGRGGARKCLRACLYAG